MENHDEIIGVLDNEAKRRRQEVINKATKAQPSFIKSIESTTVIYTVDPDILPFSLVNPQQLVLLLNKRFQLKFSSPNYDQKLFENIGLDVSKMTEEGMLRFLLQGTNPQIAFQNGRYPTGPDSFVFIEDVAFTKEKILVKVKGITDVAQQIASEAFAIFWEAAGAAKRWDDKAVQSNVALVNFQSVTNIQIGKPAEYLLNPVLKSYFDENIPGKDGLGPSMFSYSAYDKFQPNPQAIASWSFDRLVLKVHVFDPTTGASNTATIDIDTTAVSDRGKGVVEFTTALPFDKHVDVAAQIINIIDNKLDNKK